jgi:hypothetical protein
MRTKQAVEYHIVFHPIRRTDAEPGGEPLFRVMTRINVAWDIDVILARLAVQQAAPANNPARFFAKSFRLQRRNGSRPRRNMSGVVRGGRLSAPETFGDYLTSRHHAR